MRNKKKFLLISRYYTIVTVLSPFLMMYNFGISTVTFLDVAIIVGYVGVLFARHKVTLTRINGLLLFYVSMLILNFYITMLYRDYEIMSVALRMIRLSVYMLWVVVGGAVFNGELALDIWKFMCVFATAFLLFQYIALNLFNISVPGYIPFLDVSRDELVEFTENLYASSSMRPRSIFAEPSQYGIYLTGFLMIAFLKKNYSINKWVVVFLNFGMILSASTTAFLGIALSFFILCIVSSNKRKKVGSKTVIGYLILALFICGILMIFGWHYFGDMVEKILTRLPTSLDNRLNGWKIVFDKINSEGILEQIFGFGMDVELLDSLAWTPSVLKVLFYYGYFGTVVLLLGLCWFLLQRKKRVVLLVFAILLISFFTELLLSSWLVLYLPILQCIASENEVKWEVVKCE